MSILFTGMESHSTILDKGNYRRLLAMFFLICFSAHLGSHMAICANHVPDAERSVSMSRGGHDDHCKIRVLCSESRREGKQLPAPGHDVSQHNLLLDVSPQLLYPEGAREGERIDHSPGFALSRPPDPHFHPPQTS